MASPGYLLVFGHSIEGAKMVAYSAALPPIYKKYGGFYIGIGGPGRGVELLEGNWIDHSLVLARFAADGDVVKFWHSPEYVEAKKLRAGAGTFNVFAVKGNGREAPLGQPSFLISVVRPIESDKLVPLRKDWQARLAARGADILADAAYRDMERLEGDVNGIDVEIAAFPSQAAATAFWNDPATAAARAARNAVAVVNTFLVAGLPR
ncbi:MAG: DUF1330 domain-containing protein, partial [Rhodospirillaceae bacterium]|nr:DUF1330 domain-containing protein [Rhodospirillaceae bacterium]